MDRDDVVGYLDTVIEYNLSNVGILSHISKKHDTEPTISKSNELFIDVQRYHPYTINKDNYMNIETIWCMYSSISDYIYSHPTEILNHNYIVYGIDTRALALQYYYWMQDMIKNDISIEAGYFLYTIPTTNLLYSMYNMSMYNRYTVLREHKESKYTIYLSKLSVSRYDSNLDKGYRVLYDKVSSKRFSITDLLYNIPLLTTNALETLSIDYLFYTKNNYWVQYVTRGDMLLYLIDNTDIRLNRKMLQSVRNDIKLFMISKMYNIDNPYMEYIVLNNIDRINRKIDERM